MNNPLIYQIYFDEESKKNCYWDLPFVKPISNYDNPHPYFENDVIIRKVLNYQGDNDYIGIFSHKYRFKVDKDLNDVVTRKEDIITFFKACRGNYWINFERWHPGGLEALRILLEALSIDYSLPAPEVHFYQNHFICKTEIYKEYVETFLLPAVKFMQSKSNDRFEELINRKPSIGRYKIYSMHSFLCERLFTIFYHINAERFSLYQYNRLLKNV